MADNRGLTDLPLEIYNRAMPKAGVPDEDIAAITKVLSVTTKGMHGFFKQERADRKFVKELWQAVIYDERETVVKLSKERSDLFLRSVTEPIPNRFVTESKFTFQKFDLQGENLFTAVVRLKQMEMIKTLLDCCKPFEKDVLLKAALQRTILDALAKWVYYDMIIQPNTDSNAEAEEEILILPEYIHLAQSLLDVFMVETFPNGVPGQPGISFDVALSERAESALTALHNILVPKTAVKLDEHIDAELLLLAIYTVCRNHIQALNRGLTDDEWDKLDILAIRAIGLSQSAQIPETAKILCESLVEVVEALKKGQEKKISDKAARHQMKGGEDFYRSSRHVRSGMAFQFLCGIFGGWGDSVGRARVRGCWGAPGRLQQLFQAKATTVRKLRGNCDLSSNLSPTNRK